MHIIKWTSEFAVGIGEIDQQHQALVDMINALDGSTHKEYNPETMRRLLNDLSDYVRDHFGFEERLMAGSGIAPEFVERHRGEHAYFRCVLRDLTKDFEHGRARITIPLIEYLVHWFLHHIVVVDRAMVHQLNAAEPELDSRVAAALTQDVVDDLTESERHLLKELRRTSEELERQFDERTRGLIEDKHKLEAELREARAEVERLSAQLAARGAAG